MQSPGVRVHWMSLRNSEESSKTELVGKGKWLEMESEHEAGVRSYGVL